MAIQFQKATKKQAKLRMTLDGTAGSGKTYSALVVAKVLGGRTALIDTEHGSASKYANLFAFDTVALDTFSIDTYLAAIKAAADAGYEVLVIDSLSHAWTGKGGALEEVDMRGGGNKFTNGWKEVTPKHNRLIDAILAFPGHVICTMRQKTEWALEKDDKGKVVPRKVGLAPVQREGMEYEFDVVADLTIEGGLCVSKSRCPDLSGVVAKRDVIEELAGKLKAWLTDGAAPEPRPAPAPQAQATPPPSANGNGHANGNGASNGGGSVDKVKAAIAAAQTTAQLNAVMPMLRSLDKADQNAVRGLFNDRLKEVRRG